MRMNRVGVDKWKQRTVYYLNAIDMDKSEKDGEGKYKK